MSAVSPTLDQVRRQVLTYNFCLGHETALSSHFPAPVSACTATPRSTAQVEGWQFIFLGVDIDAYGIAGRFGILREATSLNSGRNSRIILREAAELFSEFAHGRLQEVGFSERAKRDAGDRHLAVSYQASSKRVTRNSAAAVQD